MEKVEIGNCEWDYVPSGLELVIRLLYKVATGEGRLREARLWNN